MADDIEKPGEKPVEKPVDQTPGANDTELGTDGKPFDPERAKETISKLRTIEAQAKKDAKELEQLRAEKQKQIDANLSETEKLKKQADDLAAENAKIKAENLRIKVVSKTGLPESFAERLKGTTEEELMADAQEILKLIPAQQKVAPKVSPTNPSGAQPVETDAQKRERLFPQQKSIFDQDVIKNNGGGVFITK